ncbi:hypothetical protein PENSPDRAFT_445732 [Peniophora sp. CONT]|nr:hypothetical protein PENSPDRAFT_445732 [Peniophora sp. CONT]
MTAVDPTYPLYPVANIIVAALLLLVLLNNAVRRSWNLSLTFLCFWLFVEALTDGIGSIIWADNADVKLYIYCDIVSRVQIVTIIVKDTAIFLLMRRLHKIAGLETMELRMRTANQRELLLDWTLGFIVPLIVAGPLYYIVEPTRFLVLEGFGCTNGAVTSVLSILILWLWGVIPPVLCVILYYPRVVRVFYQQSKSIRRFQDDSNTSPFRTPYFRILAIASIDVLLTLPIGVSNLVLTISFIRNAERTLDFNVPFYQGWTVVHQNFRSPSSTLYADLKESGTYSLAQVYLGYWSSPFLAMSIFALFGLTTEARASYRRVLYAVCSRLGWKPQALSRGRDLPELGSIEFGAPVQGMTPDNQTGSIPGFITFTPSVAEHGGDRGISR